MHSFSHICCSQGLQYAKPTKKPDSTVFSHITIRIGRVIGYFETLTLIINELHCNRIIWSNTSTESLKRREFAVTNLEKNFKFNKTNNITISLVLFCGTNCYDYTWAGKSWFLTDCAGEGIKIGLLPMTDLFWLPCWLRNRLTICKLYNVWGMLGNVFETWCFSICYPLSQTQTIGNQLSPAPV